MSTAILGLSAYYHDAAAVLLVDGEITAAAQEERFTRVKNDASFPSQSIDFCLRSSGVGVSDLSGVAFYESPWRKYSRLIETRLSVATTPARATARTLQRWTKRNLQLPATIRRNLRRGTASFEGPLYFVNHHDSHAASAFYPSPFDEAAILTLDAVGEWATSSIGVGRGNRVTLTHELRFPHSLGLLYSAFTFYLGFKVNSGEYKLMGLAPYGQPRYASLIRERLVRIAEDGSLQIDPRYFCFEEAKPLITPAFDRLFGGQRRQPDEMIVERHSDLAASIQQVCEEVMLASARHAHRLHRTRHLVMAGGVALNCVANGRLQRQGPFEHVWVQPAAGDAGGALGAALLAWHRRLDRPRPARRGDRQQGSLLGPAFTSLEIQTMLDSYGASYHRIEDECALLERVARALLEGATVGWFQGRLEYGPRSLGCRSILGDARSPTMQQVMNLKIKFRESFRPFAPCVLREHADAWFEMGRDGDSPYMLFVAAVRDAQRVPLDDTARARLQDPDLCVRALVPRSRVPAVTHVDYSARVQTVDEKRHGRFYRLLRRFHEISGCPVLVNTSFNVRGEPIVCTPEDALRCFLATDLDVLVLEDIVLDKAAQSASLRRRIPSYVIAASD